MVVISVGFAITLPTLRAYELCSDPIYYSYRRGSSGSGAQQTGIAHPVLNIADASVSIIMVILMKFIVLFLTV